MLNNKRDKEINNLKILIITGKQLDRDVKKYEKELKKYNVKIPTSKTIKTIKTKKIEPVKKITKPKISKIDTNKSEYSIKSVYTKKNSVVINFNTNITRDYVKFFERKVKSGNQDIYDIKGRFKDAHPTKLALKSVKQIVIKQQKRNILRILFEDKKNLKTVYTIRKKQLVISVLNSKSKTASKSKAVISKSSKVIKTGKKRIVVIDAGHGGKDPGAIGVGKRYEKVVAFKTTKYLESILKKRGYKVYLTRNSDKFIKVVKRPIIANKKKADIFISIHANAVPKSKINKIKGIETYFLSPARSERAKRVAARENQMDIKTMSSSTKLAFLESLNRPRITASHKLAIDVQKNMLFNARQQYKDTIDMGVREGPFYVLVGAQMPSILIELGFISHPIEGKRLYKSSYQKKLALGIANGIDSYFAKNP